MINKTTDNLYEYFSHTWQLSNPRLLAQSKFTQNYVVMCYSARYQSDVVLKICPTMDIIHEQKALTYFNGNGVVKLLDYDIENKGLLLAYVKPGTALKSLFPIHEAPTIEIVAQVIQKLHAHAQNAPLHDFQTVNQWLDLLKTHRSHKIPDALIKKASRLADKLLSSQRKVVLLHGDLHHENILQNNNEWIAIDPFGLVGEIEYEVGAFIRNPVPELLDQPHPKDIIIFRIERLSALLGFEKQRLIDWSFVQAVLAACWSDWVYYVTFAQLIEDLLERS